MTNDPKKWKVDLPEVNRVEVIDSTGRAYIAGQGTAHNVWLSVQDDGTTIKIFLENNVE